MDITRFAQNPKAEVKGSLKQKLVPVSNYAPNQPAQVSCYERQLFESYRKSIQKKDVLQLV